MEDERKVLAAISILTGFLLLLVVLWAFIKYPAENAVGDRFVKDEILVVPIYGIYLKPITIIMILAFVFWMCILEFFRAYVRKISLVAKRLLLIAFCVIALLSIYEVIWNFTFWNSAHIINPSIPLDSLNNSLNTASKVSRNFVYYTKLDSLYTAIALYSIFFLHINIRPDKKSE